VIGARAALFAALLCGCARAAPPAPPGIEDPTMAILVAAADSIVPRFAATGGDLYVTDSLTAKVLDRIGEAGRYKFTTPDATPWCDGADRATGTLARMKIDLIAGDSAAVAFMKSCLRKLPAQAEPAGSGEAGVYSLRKVDGSWIILGLSMFFEF
jgi:hypothetical protein